MAPVGDQCSPDAPTTADVSAYLRVASYSIAGFYYLTTIASEWRFYKNQQPFRPSLACLLFIAVRYLSILALITNGIGFFGRGMFTKSQCQAYYFAAPVTKCLAAIASQAIILVRTWAISWHSRPILYLLLALLIACVVPEIWSNIHARYPINDPTLQNCVSANYPHVRVSWVFYLANMLFDGVCAVVATWYLWLHSDGFKEANDFTRMVLKHGLFYTVGVTAANLVNLILYRSLDPELQGIGTTSAIAATFILSQHLILHLRYKVDHSTLGGGSSSLDPASRRRTTPSGATKGRSLSWACAAGMHMGRRSRSGRGQPLQGEKIGMGPVGGAANWHENGLAQVGNGGNWHASTTSTPPSPLPSPMLIDAGGILSSPPSSLSPFSRSPTHPSPTHPREREPSTAGTMISFHEALLAARGELEEREREREREGFGATGRGRGRRIRGEERWLEEG